MLQIIFLYKNAQIILQFQEDDNFQMIMMQSIMMIDNHQ